MHYELQAWTVSTGNEEEPCETQMECSLDTADVQAAKDWAFNRMEEGFFVCLWRR